MILCYRYNRSLIYGNKSLKWLNMDYKKSDIWTENINEKVKDLNEFMFCIIFYLMLCLKWIVTTKI